MFKIYIIVYLANFNHFSLTLGRSSHFADAPQSPNGSTTDLFKVICLFNFSVILFLFAVSLRSVLFCLYFSGHTHTWVVSASVGLIYVFTLYFGAYAYSCTGFSLYFAYPRAVWKMPFQFISQDI